MLIARYFFIGGIAACVDLGLYTSLVFLFQVNYLLAGAVGFLLATSVNYLLSVRHVFEKSARFPPRLEVTIVYLVSGIGLIIHQLVLYICVDSFEMHVLVGKLVAITIVFFWNYLIRKYYVFAPRAIDN